MQFIYLISLKTDWENAHKTREYKHPSLLKDGFIHFSFAHQVSRVANFNFRSKSDLVFLEVDASKLKSELRVEDLYSSNEDFPDEELFISCESFYREGLITACP